MTIIINTDASYHPKYNVGAFAFWIVCNAGRRIQSGPLRSVKNAMDAELQAIGNALHAVHEDKHKKIDKIFINTDCKYAILAITAGKHIGRCGETVRKVKKIIQTVASTHIDMSKKGEIKKFIIWRYVPAHTDGNTKREWVNNKMDSLAKEALWQIINQNKNKQDVK